jgi:hypothetical protein
LIDLARGFLDFGSWVPVNLHDAVTRFDASNIARTGGYNAFNMDCVVEDDEDSADVRNDPIGMIFGNFGISGINVTGVRVKSSQDERDAPLHEFVSVHGVHIFLCDKVKYGFDFGVVAFGLGCGTLIMTVNE